MDSDSSVHFPDVDVLHVADTWWNGLYLFIDYSTGSNIDGMIRATDENPARVSAETVIVPGHGPVGDKAQLTKYRDMLVAVRGRVAAHRMGKLLFDGPGEGPLRRASPAGGSGARPPRPD